MSKVLDYFNSVADRYDIQSINPAWKLLRNLELRAVKSVMGTNKQGDVLELGCGCGFYSNFIIENGCDHLRCVDLSPAMLDRMTIPNCEKIQADAENYISDRSHDLILCAGLLEFLRRPEKVFSNAVLSLKNEGVLVILFPLRSLGGLVYKLFHKCHGINAGLFSRREIVEFSQKAGLKLEAWKTVFPFTVVARFRKG